MKKSLFATLALAVLVLMTACTKKPVEYEMKSAKTNPYFMLTTTKAVYDESNDSVTVYFELKNFTDVRISASYEDIKGMNCGVAAKAQQKYDGKIVIKARKNEDVVKASFFINIDPADAPESVEIANCDVVIKDGVCTFSINVNEKAAKKALE